MGMKTPTAESPNVLTYNGRKYDLSAWIAHHPGGAPVLEHFLGTDATCAMHMFHDMRGKRLQKMLPKFDCGPDPDRPLSDFDRDYLALEEQFVARGWFKPSLPWFVYKTCMVLAFLVAALFAPWLWLKGVLLGLFVHQGAFLAHDTCHDAAFPRRYREWFGWFFGSVCFGMNHERWTREHNLHHLINNRPLQDPQINNMPELLYAYREVESFERERRPLQRRDKWLMGYAHFWLLPVLMLYGRANAIRIDVKRARRYGGKLHLRGALVHIALFAAVIASAGERWLLGLLVVPMIALALSGILHLQLILSHGYRPRLYKDEQQPLGMKVQIISNQNITTSWLTAWFHGGLDNHIEHHLFPRMPRHNLPKLRPHVQELCRKHGLPYNTAPFPVAIWDFLCSLRRESAPLRAELAAAGGSGGLPGAPKRT
jgi:fatty acid desaturase